MGYFAITVTIQRLGEPDPSSFTDRTTPVMLDPISINVVPGIEHTGRVSLRLNGSFRLSACFPKVAVRETVPRPVRKVSAKH
jgi:hypothetical protein